MTITWILKQIVRIKKKFLKSTSEKIKALITMIHFCNKPEVVNIQIQSKCNLVCSCCHSMKNNNTNDDVSCEDWMDFFDKVSKDGIPSVILRGSEPFLREDTTVLIDRIIRLGMDCKIITNGSQTNDLIARRILNNQKKYA